MPYPRATQVARLMHRAGLTREAAEQRIAAQMSSEEKLRYADYRINTDGTFEETRQLVIDVQTDLLRVQDSVQKRTI